VWKPAVCIHSGVCFRGLPQVFDPRRRPWVAIEAGSTEAIVAQVDNCPSGALSYVRNEPASSVSSSPPADAAATVPEEIDLDAETLVEPLPNGPLVVYGDLVVRDATGTLTRRQKRTTFCRCGGSQNKPFCDGAHRKNGFQG